MKKIIFVIILLIGFSSSFLVQSQQIKEDPPILYLFSDKLPKFNYEGGINKFVYSNLKMPSLSDVEGIVLISFVINKKGQVEQIKIEKGIAEYCNQEAVRIFESMPLWEPGEKDSKTVDVLMYFPVKFELKGKNK